MIKGDIINYGAYNWRVLEVSNTGTLIITEDIITLRWYHNKFENITWENAAVRQYLNNEFFNTFDEKDRIQKVINTNPGSPWFKTTGGNDTGDKIFLLSLEEVCTYFGNSTEKLHNKVKQTWFIDDENNAARQAKYNNELHSWRLRSPGYYGKTAASINIHGHVYVRGNGVHGTPKDGGGIRPALWLLS